MLVDAGMPRELARVADCWLLCVVFLHTNRVPDSLLQSSQLIRVVKLVNRAGYDKGAYVASNHGLLFEDRPGSNNIHYPILPINER